MCACGADWGYVLALRDADIKYINVSIYVFQGTLMI